MLIEMTYGWMQKLYIFLWMDRHHGYDNMLRVKHVSNLWQYGVLNSDPDVRP